MSRTIANTLTVGVTLTSSDNPLSITGTGRITEANNDAVYGSLTGSTPWTVSNSGTIVDQGVTGIGVHLKTTNYAINNQFTNQTGGLITSTHNGVVINGSGEVMNLAQATIISNDVGLASAIYVAGAGTIVNYGLVQAGNIAAYELTGGTVTNAATGTISGAGGVYLKGAGTVTNAGTIIGTNASYGAVLFDTNVGTSRLIVDPGAVFSGKIISLANSTNVIELASGSGVGTLSGFDGSGITNFATLQFDTGVDWTVVGNSLASGLGSIDITGFTIGDTIDLTGFVGVSKTFANNALVLTDASNAHATLHIQGNFGSGNFVLSSYGGTGTALTTQLACFVEGTAIATPAGPVPVETLKPGDLVQTASGDVRPVRWLGYRALNPARHPQPERAQPIRITANAFGDNVPVRDLRLSPDHAVLVDGMLIPVRLLRNDASIVCEADCRAVTYFHVELDTHDVLLAEGLATESYIDTGNRGIFQNAGSSVDLHPMFDDAQAQREAASCAPFVWNEAAVQPVWLRLAQRASAFGRPVPQLETTNDPQLRIVAEGRTIQPAYAANGRYIFALPHGVTAVRLASRAGAPNDARPWLEDRRRLGVYVERILVRIANDVQQLPLDSPALAQGWWDVERSGIGQRRWTNGDALLSLPASPGPTILEIQASTSGMVYVTSAEPVRQAA